MRCLCYAKFLSGGAIPPGEFFAHIHTQWSCIEDSPKTSHRTSNQDKPRNRFLPQSIVFVADCQSVEQLTSDLATMPGAGIANIQIFPVPEV
jgi:hypothetical protein